MRPHGVVFLFDVDNIRFWPRFVGAAHLLALNVFAVARTETKVSGDTFV
jgi:hypothetical protein